MPTYNPTSLDLAAQISPILRRDIFSNSSIQAKSFYIKDPAAGTAIYLESDDGSTAPVSGASTGRLRYNNAGAGTWQVSMQGVAYTDLVTATSISSLLTNYFYLPGRAGGQIAISGTGAGDAATITATSNATAGPIIFNTKTGFEAFRVLANKQICIGSATAPYTGWDVYINTVLGNASLLIDLYSGNHTCITSRQMVQASDGIINTLRNYEGQDIYIGIMNAAHYGGGGIAASEAFLGNTTSPVGLNIITYTATYVRCSTNTVERWRTLSTGEFIIGATTLTSTNEILSVQKNQNAGTMFVVSNSTAGTASYSGMRVIDGTVVGSIYAISSSFTTSGPAIANTMRISSGGTAGTVFDNGTAGAPFYWFTSSAETMRLTGVTTGNATLSLTQAAAGTTNTAFMQVVADGGNGGMLMTSTTFTPGSGYLADSMIFVSSGATQMQLLTIGAAPIIASTNGLERWRTLSTGEFIIGATTLVSTEKLRVNGDIRLGSDSDILPFGDGNGEIGTDLLRWGRIRAVAVVTGDLELKSEDGKANWLVREGEEDVYFINKNTGRKFRAVLEEVGA